MSSSVSATHAADPPVRREETPAAALLLGFAGGYLDIYTWITHGVLANAQNANLVFLWVHATARSGSRCSRSASASWSRCERGTV
jgi:uncharacterized membrane protein YoaK (UPF0700 family)